MNILFNLLICLMFISCGNKCYDGTFKNQFGHTLTIKESTFKYISYDGMQVEYYSFGKVSENKYSIELINDSIKNTSFYNSVQLDTIILKKKKSKLKNSDYTFRKINTAANSRLAQ